MYLHTYFYHLYLDVPPECQTKSRLESRRATSNKGRASLGDTVRKREFETRGDQLFDVRTANIVRLLNLDNTKDLKKSIKT